MKHDLHNVAPPELQRAVWEGNSEVVKDALVSGADPNSLGEHGDPLLVVASRQGHLGIVEALLEQGADVNLGTQNGTALQQAILYNNPDIAELLLKFGAAVTWYDAEQAALYGRANLLNRFILAGVSANLANADGNTFLISAAYGGHTEAVQVLLDAGTDVNRSNSNGWTALLAAASNGKAEAVRLLLEAGANPNAADKSGDTPLMRASKQGHQEIVLLLKEAGAQQ